MSAADEIAKYFDLFKAGAITEAEFATAKASLIGSPQPAQTATKNNVNAAAPAVGNNSNGSSKNQKNNSKTGQKFPANTNPLQTGVAVAAGVVGGRLISDKLLDDPSTDPATLSTETITFPDGDTFSGAAVEMPNGDVFYSITESTESSTQTFTGSLTAQEVAELNNDHSDIGGGDHYHHHHETSGQVSESDSGSFDSFDFF
jgi:hypothetical protein